jgi:excisionase family DNA binding protein
LTRQTERYTIPLSQEGLGMAARPIRFMRMRKPNAPSPYPGPGASLEDYELMTPDELGEFMKISKTSVYRLVESRILPAYRIGGVLRFRKQDVIAYLESKKTDAVNWHL